MRMHQHGPSAWTTPRPGAGGPRVELGAWWRARTKAVQEEAPLSGRIHGGSSPRTSAQLGGHPAARWRLLENATPRATPPHPARVLGQQPRCGVCQGGAYFGDDQIDFPGRRLVARTSSEHTSAAWTMARGASSPQRPPQRPHQGRRQQGSRLAAHNTVSTRPSPCNTDCGSFVVPTEL